MSSFFELKPGERVTFDTALVYAEQWCDGNGNLGPCACADDEKVGRGHWRGGRRINLAELLQRVAEAQREEAARMVEGADDGVPLQCLADAIREASLVTEEKP